MFLRAFKMPGRRTWGSPGSVWNRKPCGGKATPSWQCPGEMRGTHAGGEPHVRAPRLYHVCEILAAQANGLILSLQVVLSVSMAPGGSRESWPCPGLWGIIRWKISMWSSQTQISWPLTWTSSSPSSWSWHQMASGMLSATKKPFDSSRSAWMNLTLGLRA